MAVHLLPLRHDCIARGLHGNDYLPDDFSSC
jgi:hypothetical protein